MAAGGRVTPSPAEILAEARTIAIVGASPKPWRPSHDVMRYLLEQGYRAIPVRPGDCAEVLGVPCVPSLAAVPSPVDLVDVFRRPEHAPAVAREAVAVGARALWLQVGIVSPEAREVAEAAGIDYVENACTKVVHKLYLA
jgi:predicted CoA-binding protein